MKVWTDAPGGEDLILIDAAKDSLVVEFTVEDIAQILKAGPGRRIAEGPTADDVEDLLKRVRESSPPGPEPPSPADQLETGLLDLVKTRPLGAMLTTGRGMDLEAGIRKLVNEYRGALGRAPSVEMDEGAGL